MFKTHFWNRLHIPRNQILKFFVIGFTLMPLVVSGQTKNKPLYDYNKTLHFGFSIGTNVSGFSHEFSDNFKRNDTLLSIDKERSPGLTLGAIANLHLGEHFDLRFIPGLALSQRNIEYEWENRPNEVKEIESIFVEAPLTFKFKSKRHENVRFYVIGGGKIAQDMASQEDTEQNPFDPFVALKPVNYSYEFGFGFDLYFPYFKLSPELKISRGINNVLVKDDNIYSGSFDVLRSNIIFLSFHFE